MSPRFRKTVSVETCADWRGQAHEGLSAREIGEETDFAWRTVSDHIHGDCQCDVSVESVEGQRSPITAEECQRFRAEYVANPNTYKIAEGHEPSRNVVEYHVSGRCNHPGEGIPTTRFTIHPYFWDAVYFLYFQNHVSPEYIAEVFDVSEQSVASLLGEMTDKVRD